ncbi:MAG: hypothetical protein V4662_01995 [Verrucomicrobiota bacterium]
MSETIAKELSLGELIEVLKLYQASHPVSDKVNDFEKNLERQIIESLEGLWQYGWDFSSSTHMFGDRGVSFLIQNSRMDWAHSWDWIVTQSSVIPLGAMINFEVWDNIVDNQMLGGHMILRRVILSSGVYAEIP